MLTTERFYQIRKQELDNIFTKKDIASIWRKIVRDQLRRVDIIDIFDYYDFNYNIDDRALILRTQILNGNYEPSQPIIYRIEKKFGISRHLIIPQPLDALVLQVITETISKEILNKQPSNNSFYSRDKHNVRKPHEIDDYGFNWRKLWKKMQKKIFNFKQTKNLIIVTDLTNYYDSIYIPELRKTISGYIENKEGLQDILFKIIEKISWLPDYLPYVGRGLPTTNLEGVRLLAHSFLFELDTVLKNKSNDSFTRWMDDIVIGVDDREEAINILSSASDVLKSRGLAFNLKKTDIYSVEKAEFHFLINENNYIDGIDIDYYLKNGIKQISSELIKRFNKHLKNNKAAKYYEKITKRYITTFSKLKSKRILKSVPALFNEHPGIRSNLLYYLSSLGYSKRTAAIVLRILDELKLHDDISLFNISKLITDWEIPTTKEGEDFIKEVINKVKSFSINRKEPFDFYCLLWIKSKYEHPDDLFKFIFDYEYIWKSYSFLRRQVTSIIARLLPYKEDKVKAFLNKQIATAEPNVVSVANTILNFAKIKVIESKVKMYLFPQNGHKILPLNKFLVLCSFLNSNTYKNDKDVKQKIVDKITDPYYRKWIEFQYNIK
jgi:hypothetical protein